MKSFLFFSFILLTSIGFSQNQNQNNGIKPSIIEAEIDETAKVSSLDLNSQIRVNDEGTNNPETTGSTKKIVNGKELYVKESDLNGLKMTIITEPK